MKQPKIVCTIGPASDEKETLRRLIKAGMNVARLNFSHGSHKEHHRRIQVIRELNREKGPDAKILQDLEGYRIRIGEFDHKTPIDLKLGDIVKLVKGKGDRRAKKIPFDYDGPFTDIPVDEEIYIDDGQILLYAVRSNSKSIKAKVIRGGILKPRKGVNIPGIRLPMKGLSFKDEADLEFGVRENVDWIAQSFVRTKRDVLELRKRVPRSHRHIQVIAKIENRQGLNNLDEILPHVDGMMVARGDLGVSVPIHRVPMMQKWIIRQCKKHRKFVITATQMLESMTEHWRPTRAEVTDVANAVMDGSDYLMLSGETAAGKYPVLSVEMMHRIIAYTQDAMKRPRRFFWK
ncbi:MAG: pyruvate kinase [Candidatus Omnitrophica bacterium]|nr:pyruvate kinase [Candidatus Omnitrophota bacterium]